jgi:hypothetical protein
VCVCVCIYVYYRVNMLESWSLFFWSLPWLLSGRGGPTLTKTQTRAKIKKVKFGHASPSQRLVFRGGGPKKATEGTLRHPTPSIFNFFHFWLARPPANCIISAVWKFQVLIMTGTCSIFRPKIQYTFFRGSKNGLRMMISGLNHLLGRVKRSDLVQSGRDTSPDVVGGLTRAHEW